MSLRDLVERASELVVEDDRSPFAFRIRRFNAAELAQRSGLVDIPGLIAAVTATREVESEETRERVVKRARAKARKADEDPDAAEAAAVAEWEAAVAKQIEAAVTKTVTADPDVFAKLQRHRVAKVCAAVISGRDGDGVWSPCRLVPDAADEDLDQGWIWYGRLDKPICAALDAGVLELMGEGGRAAELLRPFREGTGAAPGAGQGGAPLRAVAS